MNTQEVIERVKNQESIVNSLEQDEKCIILMALEKRIPMKIVHNPEAGREADWTCPACKRTCSPYARHCQNCGQALYKED